MTTTQTKLVKEQPRLIQRCTLDRERNKLCYEYMGSAEFEFGDQAKSLKRIFDGKVEIRFCFAQFNEEAVKFWLVAREDFNLDSYAAVLQGLIEERWRTKETTY